MNILHYMRNCSTEYLGSFSCKPHNARTSFFLPRLPFFYPCTIFCFPYFYQTFLLVYRLRQYTQFGCKFVIRRLLQFTTDSAQWQLHNAWLRQTSYWSAQPLRAACFFFCAVSSVHNNCLISFHELFHYLTILISFFWNSCKESCIFQQPWP